MVEAFIASLKVAVTTVVTATPVAPDAGEMLTTVGGVVSTPATLTESPTHVAGISCASIFDSTPLDRLIALLVPAEPMTWKCSTAKYPEPLTPDRPETFWTTRHVPVLISLVISTGTGVDPISPEVTLSSRSTEALKDTSYWQASKFVTSLILTLAVKSLPGAAVSGALMLTVTIPGGAEVVVKLHE